MLFLSVDFTKPKTRLLVSAVKRLRKSSYFCPLCMYTFLRISCKLYIEKFLGVVIVISTLFKCQRDRMERHRIILSCIYIVHFGDTRNFELFSNLLGVKSSTELIFWTEISISSYFSLSDGNSGSNHPKYPNFFWFFKLVPTSLFLY